MRDNRKALVTDVEKLTRVMKTINSEKDSIDTALTVAPVAMGNLVLAFDPKSGVDRLADRRRAATSGTSTASCARSSSSPACRAVSKDLACTLFEQIVESGTPSKAAVRQAVRQAEAAATTPGAERDPRSTDGPGDLRQRRAAPRSTTCSEVPS